MTPCSFQYFPCLGQNSQFNYIAQDKGQNPRRLVLQPFKAIHVRVIAFVYLECKTNFIKQIRSIVQVITLFITRTDSHKIIYPVYLYLYNGQQLFFFDFGLLSSSSSHTFPYRRATFGGCDELSARAYHENKDIPPLDQKIIIK